MKNEMNCEDVIRVLYAYLDGELRPESETEVDEHIHRCQECMGRAEFERQLRKRIREVGSTPTPEALRKRLVSLIDEEK